MNAIAAVSLNWGIGRKGELLFHIADDLRRFRAMTLGLIGCGAKNNGGRWCCR